MKKKPVKKPPAKKKPVVSFRRAPSAKKPAPKAAPKKPAPRKAEAAVSVGEKLPVIVKSSAVISDPFRYTLYRVWDYKKPVLVFVMLNPSTADADNNDPTIRRCISFAVALGYGALVVVNMFALRATDPAQLDNVSDPFGPSNAQYVWSCCSQRDVIVAWGARRPIIKKWNADRITFDNIMRSKPNKVMALAVNADGSPKHPLYISGSAKPKAWRMK